MTDSKKLTFCIIEKSFSAHLTLFQTFNSRIWPHTTCAIGLRLHYLCQYVFVLNIPWRLLEDFMACCFFCWIFFKFDCQIFVKNIYDFWKTDIKKSFDSPKKFSDTIFWYMISLNIQLPSVIAMAYVMRKFRWHMAPLKSLEKVL